MCKSRPWYLLLWTSNRLDCSSMPFIQAGFLALTFLWQHCSSSLEGSHNSAPRTHAGWSSHTVPAHCGWPHEAEHQSHLAPATETIACESICSPQLGPQVPAGKRNVVFTYTSMTIMHITHILAHMPSDTPASQMFVILKDLFGKTCSNQTVLNFLHYTHNASPLTSMLYVLSRKWNKVWTLLNMHSGMTSLSPLNTSFHIRHLSSFFVCALHCF